MNEETLNSAANKYTLREIQNKLLEMLNWFHEFCAQNGLKYFAIGGTLLGAVRHKGFIPWDDDIDLGMPRDDYKRFLSLAKGLIDSRFVAETADDGKEGFIYSFCKLYDTSTTVVYKTKYKTKRGLFLDIFPLDGIGETLEEGVKNYRKVEFKNRVISAKRGKISKNKPFYQNASVFIAKFIPYNWHKALKKLHALCEERDYNTSKFVGNLFGRWHEHEIVEREWFGEPKEYEFENIRICGPNDADSYLKSIYGDYMTLPPEQNRKPDHDFIFIDLDRSYLNEEEK